ncbi:MAG: hypothetical protein DA330_04415 [Nitrososphaera sp.]|nr:hypothetical protein [Nitrososphaera sp.]
MDFLSNLGIFIGQNAVIDFINQFFSWLIPEEGVTPGLILNISLLAILVVFVDLFRSISKGFLLGLYELYRRYRPLALPTSNFPKISILIPAHNESAAIRKTIQSILDNPYPNKEIIVIDDHSKDNTYEIASAFSDKGLIKLIKRMEGKGSKSGAVNYGAVFATGDYMIVIDGDTVIERTALSEMARHLSAPNVIAGLGIVRVLGGDGGVNNLLTKLQEFEYLIAFEIGRRFNSLFNLLIIIPGAFSIFSTKSAKKVGLFDKDTITEDFDIAIKLHKVKGDIAFIPEARAWTYCPNNLKAWMRQRIRWSHGQLAVLAKHRDASRQAYQHHLRLSFYDMVAIDVVLLFLRLSGFVILLFSNTQHIIFTMAFILFLYHINETISFFTSIALAKDKNKLKYFYLIPVMVLFYRPLYSAIRIYAYIKWIFGSEIKW